MALDVLSCAAAFAGVVTTGATAESPGGDVSRRHVLDFQKFSAPERSKARYVVTTKETWNTFGSKCCRSNKFIDNLNI